MLCIRSYTLLESPPACLYLGEPFLLQLKNVSTDKNIVYDEGYV